MPNDMMTLTESFDKGFSAIQDFQKSPDHEKRILEVMDVITNKRRLAPHRAEYLMREAMTTSDFPLLFGDVLDRQVLAAYRGVDPVWRAFTRPSTVRRIYPQVGGYRFAVVGGDQALEEVAEKGEYKPSKRTETRYPVYVKKYGRQFDISWESIINDDLGALRDTPTRFALAAARTEHRLVTTAYCSDLGTHAGGNLYENGVNEGALPLTLTNLELCLQAMSSFQDVNSEPILNKAKYLVVTPKLEMAARAILTSAMKAWVMAGDGDVAAAPYPTANIIPQMGLTLVVDPYLPIIDSTKTTSWYLFADPADIAAIEVDTLEGHDRPEICMKDSDKVAVGGGAISPLEGDFATDNILYRVRDVFGANKLDWRATYANIVA